jgi:hypothetical protein
LTIAIFAQRGNVGRGFIQELERLCETVLEQIDGDEPEQQYFGKLLTQLKGPRQRADFFEGQRELVRVAIFGNPEFSHHMRAGPDQQRTGGIVFIEERASRWTKSALEHWHKIAEDLKCDAESWSRR